VLQKGLSWGESTNPMHIMLGFQCCIRLIVTMKKLMAESTEYEARSQKAEFPSDLLMADSSRLYNMCSQTITDAAEQLNFVVNLVLQPIIPSLIVLDLIHQFPTKPMHFFSMAMFVPPPPSECNITCIPKTELLTGVSMHLHCESNFLQSFPGLPLRVTPCWQCPSCPSVLSIQEPLG